MKHLWACALFGCLFATDAQAQTVFGALNARERAAFGVEVRAALLANPKIIAGVSDAQIFAPPHGESPILQAYAQAVSDDLALIRAHSGRLFAPVGMAFGTDNGAPIALFVMPDCPDCARAISDLRALAKHVDMRVTVIDILEEADMAATLGIDRAPSYVLPNMMIRGQMPNIVLMQYLTDLNQTGSANKTDPARP